MGGGEGEDCSARNSWSLGKRYWWGSWGGGELERGVEEIEEAVEERENAEEEERREVVEEGEGGGKEEEAKEAAVAGEWGWKRVIEINQLCLFSSFLPPASPPSPPSCGNIFFLFSPPFSSSP